MKRLDDYIGIPMLFFDEDTRVLFIANKGESATSFYQYSSESPNYLDLLYAYKGKEPQKGFSFMPKRAVDLMSCEMMRGVRLTAKTIEYISFKVPRKSGTFQADLYPNCKSMNPALTCDEWWSGVDKEADRMELKPSTDSNQHHASMQKKQTFMAKLSGKPEPTGFTGYQETSNSSNNSDEIKELQHQINSLSDDLEIARV